MHVRLWMMTLLSIAAGSQAGQARMLPADDLNLRLTAPVQRWDEALPLGNGLLGVLLWGEGDTLRLSLDRGDLWDNRHPPRIYEADFTWKEIQAVVAKGNQEELVRRFDSTYGIDYPTKLPGGRLEIDLAPGSALTEFELDLSSAVGIARAGQHLRCEGFVASDRPVALFRIPGPPPKQLRMVPSVAVRKLGYPDAETGGDESSAWYRQEGSGGVVYGAVAQTRRVGEETLLAVTIGTSLDGGDPLAWARKVNGEALQAGYERCRREHEVYWYRFWSASGVQVPDAHIQQHYTLVNYYLGAASRPGAPPMPLQGVWTADAGNLPPWHGDFHHDLNTQMSYVSYPAAGRFEEGRVFLDFMVGLLPEFRTFAHRFYQAPGAAIPGVMSLDGEMMGGWVQYSLSPGNGAWVAWMFYRHWLYTRDPGDLQQAYTFCSEIGICLKHLLQPDAQGILKLPLSSSPEIHNNSMRAWLSPNSNYDRDSLEALFLGLADMAGALRKPEAATDWKALAAGLGPRIVADDDVLMFSEGELFTQSHRHHSHMMAMHPFGLLHVEQGPEAARVIQQTLARVEELGTQAWTGYSFSWMASHYARARKPESALRYMELFVRAFILRNGFHVNGDQLKAGFSGFTYRPFTLEGNFLAAEAVQDMLLQSWGGTIRVFPACPWKWHEASFEQLRAEGACTVSARRENNATIEVRIRAGRDGIVRVEDPFPGRKASWNRDPIGMENGIYQFQLAAGELLEGTAAKPEQVPPQPANAFFQLELPRRIGKNTLPLQFGSDSNGGSVFPGSFERASVYNRVLSAKEVTTLAGHRSDTPPVTDGLIVRRAKEPGKGLSIPHRNELNCLDGVTLEAWIRPESRILMSGARIIDKSPVGGSTGYLLDTYPGNSLRLISMDGHLTFPARIPLGEWTHVAGTIDGDSGEARLYLNGREVAYRPGVGGAGR